MAAGSLPGSPRKVHATCPTLKDIETIFSDRLWPNLASWDDKDSTHVALVYSKYVPPTNVHPTALTPYFTTRLCTDGQYQPITECISVRAMPLSHGLQQTTSLPYESTAFFIRHLPSAHEFLFFGDVEPDSIAGAGRTQAVWDAAACLIPHHLSTIFIECSWPRGRPDDVLYGHLNPEHLVEELTNLAKSLWRIRNHPNPTTTSAAVDEETGTKTRHSRKRQKRNHASIPPVAAVTAEPSADALRGVLDGVRVVVIHCKEDLRGEFDKPINLVIADQIRELVDERGLGVEVVTAVQGMHICTPSISSRNASPS